MSEHGTGRYNAGCRCDECRRNHRERHLEWARRRGPSAREHGTNARYQSGCRCDQCRTANRDRSRSYWDRRRQSDYTINTLRVQAGKQAARRRYGENYAPMNLRLTGLTQEQRLIVSRLVKDMREKAA